MQQVSRRSWVAIGTVVVAIVAVWLVVAMRSEQPPWVSRGGDAVPVILIHGYGGNSSSMGAIEARLQREGRQVLSVDLPAGGTGDILGSARVVEETVAGTGAETVDLIGFSMGGVVARSYVSDLGGAARARYVIALASPNHGTGVAGLATFADPSACTGACEQLAPESEFLESLNEPDETPEGPSFVTIWTERDETVTPPGSAELDGALNIKIQDVCPDSRVGHGEMSSDPAVLGLIVETVTGRLTALPEPERCDSLEALGA